MSFRPIHGRCPSPYLVFLTPFPVYGGDGSSTCRKVAARRNITGIATLSVSKGKLGEGYPHYSTCFYHV
jgi:hypothetical protein